jgi:hypothetical protein
MIDGQKLSQTLGDPEFVAQYFFEIPASDGAVYLLASNIYLKKLLWFLCIVYSIWGETHAPHYTSVNNTQTTNSLYSTIEHKTIILL